MVRYPEYPVRIFIVLVKAEFFCHKKDNDPEGSEAQGQSGNINN
jgi:hypothetical protein